MLSSQLSTKVYQMPSIGESDWLLCHLQRTKCVLPSEWSDTLWGTLLGSGLASGTVPAGLPLSVPQGSPRRELQVSSAPASCTSTIPTLSRAMPGCLQGAWNSMGLNCPGPLTCTVQTHAAQGSAEGGHLRTLRADLDYTQNSNCTGSWHPHVQG